MAARRPRPTGERATAERPTGERAIAARRPLALAHSPASREEGDSAREQLGRIQRARIVAGAIDVACERGAANVSVADIVARCGVSRRTFYETFADRDECFLAAFEDALGLATDEVLTAAQTERHWIAKLRAGIAAFLRFLDERPKLGRLLICDSLVAGPRVLARRTEIADRLAAFAYEGRRESKLAPSTQRMQAEGVVGGALAILHKLLLSGSTEPYATLAPSLTAMVAMPYLGPAAAQRELDRPVADIPTPGPSHDPVSLADPFKHSGMRLTYRTVRALSIVAEQGERGIHPSNRVIGELAGIRDQGQISKLLRRLQRFGLIDNESDPECGQGVPNAWRLTGAGRQLAKSIAQHTQGLTRAQMTEEKA